MTAALPRRMNWLGVVTLAIVWIAGCTDPNIISKTKIDGKQVIKTCDDFKKEVSALIEANAANATFRAAENDNAEFNYWFLEPGQFEQKGDTLYFRLRNDLEYAKYLTKGAAILVKAQYTSQDHLQDIEKDPSGQLGALTIDENYIKKNSKPFLVYKMPVQGRLNGKQITFQFTAVQLDTKTGKVKRVFCDTEAKPVGPLDGECCTDKAYDRVRPKSIVSMPAIDIKDENYRYRGITGTLDLIFPMSSTKFDRKQLTLVIKDYVTKYEAEGYKLKTIDMSGWASQGGKVDFNQKLSEARVQAVMADLKEAYDKAGRTDITITGQGRGEDWERLELLVKTAVFTDDERGQVLAISGTGEDPDAKEAKLRKLKFWKKFVDEVLKYCRHTFITFTFDYKPDAMAYESYPTQIPIISSELYNVATQQRVISRYQPGADVMKSLDLLNNFIDVQNFKTGNLYAMRSTYHYMGKGDVFAAIQDMEKAQGADKANMQYGMATLALKTENAYFYNIGDRMKLLNSYNDYVARYPNDKMLAYNRAVMMDRVGYISGAMAEYGTLMASDARNAAALNNRGVAKLKTNRFTEAEADFKEALGVDANMAEAYYNLAIVYAYRGLTDKAVENLDRAIALKPAMKADVSQNAAFSVMRNTPKFNKYK